MSSTLGRASRFTSDGDPLQIAKSFASKTLNIKTDSYRVKDVYKTVSTGVTHIFLKQIEHGMEITNGDCAIHIDANGVVIAYSNNFRSNNDNAKRKLWAGQSSHRFVRPKEAFSALADYIKRPLNNIDDIVETPHTDEHSNKAQFLLNFQSDIYKKVTAQQSYIHTNNGTLEPSWEFFVDLDENYFNGHVSADGREILSLNDWTSAASYNVIPIGDNDLETAKRTLVQNPENSKASPEGWHVYEGKQTYTTWGNNVNAKVASKQKDVPAFQPKSENQVFDYPVDLTKEASEYKEAAVTQLFYGANVMHDVFYQYGFDEQAGNFQKDNFNRGGLGNDEIIASAQDPLSLNNALFRAPPDGQQPEMRMYLWTGFTPNRDGDLVNDIIVHEYSHGISGRLTGGPSNPNCLMGRESQGMGEGWGDFFSVFLRMKESDQKDKIIRIGEYIQQDGIRIYPYSTDQAVNPTMYGMVHTMAWTEKHKIGEIWANILYELYWELVSKLGFDNDKYSANITKGNTLAVKLVVDGMKLQPCNPTFISGRDAILQAEKVITRGSYKCLIWTAFAKRGVGANATTDGTRNVVQDTSLPSDCKH
ncbi:Fungalysin metallopeptidase-domain-containing protein [Syncephalis plumigaleata]|nr:Fungalysin metallopeptidase-domain-containing protein [Syncephalis plumigaleata]